MPIMGAQEWQFAASVGGLTAEELAWFQEAFDDLERLGLNDYCELLEQELTTALSAVPAPQSIVQRLTVRRIVFTEALGVIEHEALRDMEGPTQ